MYNNAGSQGDPGSIRRENHCMQRLRTSLLMMMTTMTMITTMMMMMEMVNMCWSDCQITLLMNDFSKKKDPDKVCQPQVIRGHKTIEMRKRMVVAQVHMTICK